LKLKLKLKKKRLSKLLNLLPKKNLLPKQSPKSRLRRPKNPHKNKQKRRQRRKLLNPRLK
jgi:hypothetical protein